MPDEDVLDSESEAITPANLASERLITLGIIKDDFRAFLTELWNDRQLNAVAPLGDYEYDIADWLCYGDRTEKSRYRCALAPRGTGKTYIGPAALACFRLLRDPQRKILIDSKSENHAKKILRVIREWMSQVWFLQHLHPPRGNVSTTTMMQVNGANPSIQPSITAIGIDGMLEGNRAHTIFADDVETEKNTLTPERRQSLLDRTGEFKDILYPDVAGLRDPVEIIGVGTFHHIDSVYMEWSKRGYAVRTWPLCAPQERDQFLNLAPLIEKRLESGEIPYTKDGAYELNPLFPLRFPAKEVLARMKEGRTRFGMQHMLISNLGDTALYPLKLSDLIVMDLHRDKAPVTVGYGRNNPTTGATTLAQDIPQLGLGDDRLYRPMMIDQIWAPYSRTIAFIDPSGRGTDKQGLSVVGALNGQFFVKACMAFKGGMDEPQLAELARWVKHFGATECYYEKNFDGFGAMGQLLEVELKKLYEQPGGPNYPDGWACSLEGVESGRTQKERRIIDALEPITSTHRLIVDSAVVRPEPDEEIENTFQFQFTRITMDRDCLNEDGKIDSLAGALRILVHEVYMNDPSLNRNSQLDYEYEKDRRHLETIKAQARRGQAPDRPRMYRKSWEVRRPTGAVRGPMH